MVNEHKYYVTINLYSNLTVYGNVYPTKIRLPDPDKFVQWTEENFTYVKYNPRKEINRFGLSITSLDGGLSGVSDLDSLAEYNLENSVSLHETSFNICTPVYDYPSLKQILFPIKDYIFRSHILKLNPGGFFPPHRDFRGSDFRSFRLIIPLKNMNPPECTFIVNNKIQYWKEGTVYFVDTAMMHYLFNASFNPAYMIVLNVGLDINSIKFVVNNMQYL
jgi:hypothetical protein